MNTADILTLVIAIGGVLGVFVTWLTWREAHRSNIVTADANNIKIAVEHGIQPLADKLSENNTRLSVAEVQLDLLWKNLQKDMAKLMHSPDPKRSHIDHLMDKIIDDVPLSPQEENELRDILVRIIQYEPGVSPDLGFPLHPGEKMQAAFLLRSLDYVPIHGR